MRELSELPWKNREIKLYKGDARNSAAIEDEPNLIITSPLCECGCNQRVAKVSNRFIWGHHIRVSNPMKNPSIAAKMAATIRGRPKSEETRKKLSLAAIRTYQQGRKSNCGMLGRKHTAETKAKISRIHKGRKFTDEHKRKLAVSKLGDRNPMRRPEVAAKISLARKGKYTGKDNPNWRGGISFKPYGQEFNEVLKFCIRKRDNFICQKCGAGEGNLIRALDVHHIDYNKANSGEDNLIALCISCNAQVNFSRAYWQALFEEKLINEMGPLPA